MCYLVLHFPCWTVPRFATQRTAFATPLDYAISDEMTPTRSASSRTSVKVVVRQYEVDFERRKRRYCANSGDMLWEEKTRWHWCLIWREIDECAGRDCQKRTFSSPFAILDCTDDKTLPLSLIGFYCVCSGPPPSALHPENAFHQTSMGYAQ